MLPTPTNARTSPKAWHVLHVLGWSRAGAMPAPEGKQCDGEVGRERQGDRGAGVTGGAQGRGEDSRGQKQQLQRRP